MKKFVIQVLLFLSPVVFILSIPSFFFLISKENFISEEYLEQVLAKKKEVLIGYLYNESNYQGIKRIAITQNPKNDVLVLGSSRVIQFRDFMFNSSFYNAGYTISTINQFKDFLTTMPQEKLPKVLIVGLDQWMFNEHWDKVESTDSTDFFDPKKSKIIFEPSSKQIKYFWRDIFSGKSFLFSNKSVFNSKGSQTFGLNAFWYKMGYRHDGSFDYGNRIKGLLEGDSKVHDFGFQDTFERIEKGVFRFEYGDQVNPKALIAFEELLNYCKEKNIRLVAFLPPFAPSVVNKLQDSGNHKFIERLPEILNKYSNDKGVEIWDFTDVTNLNSSDQSFLDGFHAGEVCHLRMLIHMGENNSLLGDFTDLNELRTLISLRRNQLELNPEK